MGYNISHLENKKREVKRLKTVPSKSLIKLVVQRDLREDLVEMLQKEIKEINKKIDAKCK